MGFRLGIIGAGGIGSWHAESAAAVGIEVASVCDLDLTRANGVASVYPGATATTSREELLGQVDAVAVATPNAFHRECAVAALAAGKDVLLEKPMAICPAECDEIITAGESSAGQLQIGFVCRCAPAARAAWRLIEAGTLGRIYHVRASLCRQRGIPGLGRWFTTRSLSGGGVMMDLGGHMLDLALHLTGQPAPRRASAVMTANFGNPPAAYRFTEMWAGPPKLDGVFDVEDGVSALVRCDGGISIELRTTWAANIPTACVRDGLILLGEEAGCYLDLWTNTLVISRERDGVVTDETIAIDSDDPWAEAWQEQYRRFEQVVTARATPTATAEEGRVAQTVIEALYRSAGSDAEVEV